MKLFGSLTELKTLVYRDINSSHQLTLEPNQTTPILTADRTFTLPPINANEAILGAAATQTVSNKSFDDTNSYTCQDNAFAFQNAADGTKLAHISCATIATGTTRTFTFPNANVTLVGDTNTQTLTNKTLASPNISTQATIQAAGSLQFNNASNSNYVAFQGGASTANTTWTLPTADGSSNQFLQTNGSAVLTWASALSSPMTTLGDIIYENATPAAARLAGNTTTTKNFLTQTGNGSISAAPAWGTIASGDLPAATSTAQGAVVGKKLYFFGTSYTNGTPTIANVSGFGTITTSSNSWVMPQETVDGSWLISFNFDISTNSVSSGECSISGITFSTNSNQSMSANGINGPSAGYAETIPNTANIFIATGTATTENQWCVGGTCLVQSKPTWAD